MPSVTHSTSVTYTTERYTYSSRSETYRRSYTTTTPEYHTSVTVPPYETASPEYHTQVTKSSYVTESPEPQYYEVPPVNYTSPSGHFSETSPDPSFTVPPFEGRYGNTGSGTTPPGFGSGGASVDP